MEKNKFGKGSDTRKGEGNFFLKKFQCHNVTYNDTCRPCGIPGYSDRQYPKVRDIFFFDILVKISLPFLDLDVSLCQ